MGIFDRDSDRMISFKDALWFDEMDMQDALYGGGDDGCGCSCTTIIGVFLGILIGVLFVVWLHSL